MRKTRMVCIQILLYLIGISPIGSLHAAESQKDAATGDPGEIVIGATFPLTGIHEHYGQSAYLGATIRVKMINDAGGIHGKKLVIRWKDNGSEPAQAERDFRELVKDYQVPAVLGPLLSEGVLAARETAKELGIVLMTPLATIDQATKDNIWVFRACFNNTAEAKGLISFQMNSYGARSCGILYDSSFAFSIELAEIFAKIFEEQGGRVVGSYSITDANGNKDYRTPLQRLAAENPDFIFAPCYALEATEIIHTARDAKIGIRFCGSDTWDNQLVFDAAGSRLSGTSFASALFEQSFSYRPFQTFFAAMEKAGMDNPDAQAACAYDAVTMLARALENGDTPEDVRDGLGEIKRISLVTGRTSMTPEGDAIKPVLIRVVERRESGLVPVYGERYDP